MKEIETLSVIEKTLLLSQWGLFQRLATDEVALIAARTGEVEYAAGEVVDPEGPTGSSIHFVVRGAIEISESGSSIRRAGEGDVIGSLAVLGGDTTEEELRVLESTHALVLSGRDFESAIADHPDFAMAVIRSLVATVRGMEAGLRHTEKGN